jgi:hypothetical protein
MNSNEPLSSFLNSDVNSEYFNESVELRGLVKGMCYSPFPPPYDPSTANHTCIFFGSDIASHNMKSLWGTPFSPLDGPDKDRSFFGRNDIGSLQVMGVNVIRLYDWDPRNDHRPFLDYCEQHRIKVLVPVSNYFLGAYGSPPNMDDSISNLIESFSDDKCTDYHPAIYGIIIGNELDQSTKMPAGYLVDFTKRWIEIEKCLLSNYRKVPIGHPTSFATYGEGYPCFKYWDKFIAELKDIEDLNDRLILCPQTYSDEEYLFNNAEGSGKGWVDLAYERYNLRMLFTEIGCSRLARDDYLEVIEGQLDKSLIYAARNPEKLLGTCYFQFCDKVWAYGTVEGAYGVFANGERAISTVRYGSKDFPHKDGMSCENESLNIQVLKSNPVLAVIKKIYNPLNRYTS